MGSTASSLTQQMRSTGCRRYGIIQLTEVALHRHWDLGWTLPGILVTCIDVLEIFTEHIVCDGCVVVCLRPHSICREKPRNCRVVTDLSQVMGPFIVMCSRRDLNLYHKGSRKEIYWQLIDTITLPLKHHCSTSFPKLISNADWGNATEMSKLNSSFL